MREFGDDCRTGQECCLAAMSELDLVSIGGSRHEESTHRCRPAQPGQLLVL
jgi:hypothetical protein